MKVICKKLNEEIKYEEYADGAKVIPHSTLEDILRRHSDRFEYEPKAVLVSPEMVVVECRITDKETGETVLKVGESNPMNLESDIARKYPATIAYQRAIDRAVVAILGLGAKFYSDQEINRRILAEAEKLLDTSPREKKSRKTLLSDDIDALIDEVVEETVSKKEPIVEEEPIDDSFLGLSSSDEIEAEEIEVTEETKAEEIEVTEETKAEETEADEIEAEETEAEEIEATEEPEVPVETAETEDSIIDDISDTETMSVEEIEWVESFSDDETAGEPADEVSEEESSAEVEEVIDEKIEAAAEEAPAAETEVDEFDDDSYFLEEDVEDDSYVSIEPPKKKVTKKPVKPSPRVVVSPPKDEFDDDMDGFGSLPVKATEVAEAAPAGLDEDLEADIEDEHEEHTPETEASAVEDEEFAETIEDLTDEDFADVESEPDDSEEAAYERFLDSTILFGSLSGKKVRDMLGKSIFLQFMKVVERNSTKNFMKFTDAARKAQMEEFIRFKERLLA